MNAKSIHPFPARMAPEIAQRWIDDLPKNASVLDPMCGSGVVLRHAAASGRHARGFDLDPLAVLMSKVWTRRGSHARLAGFRDRLLESAYRKRCGHASLPNLRRCPETTAFVEYWFAEPQRLQLARLSSALRELSNECPAWVTNALALALSKTIVTKQVGASLAWDVSHSRPHLKRTENDYDVFAGFDRAVDQLIAQLDASKIAKEASVRLGDCRRLTWMRPDSVHAVITSPPYANAIDYLRGHRLALVWLGHSLPALRGVRSSAIGTERTRGGVSTTQGSSALSGEVLNLPPRQQAIIQKYEQDALAFAKEMRRVLKPGGKLVLVLADSVIRGVEVSSSKIFAAAARSHGFVLEKSEIREIPTNKRYLPMGVGQVELDRRMKFEKIQQFSLSKRRSS